MPMVLLRRDPLELNGVGANGVGGNLIFDSLIIQDTNSNAADIPSGNAMSVNRKIEIQTPLSTVTRKFKILATT